MINTPKIPVTQAERVYARFGGARQVFEALGRLAAATGDERHRRCLVQVYKWNMPRVKAGNGGFIPGPALQSIKLAARREGILLNPEDTCA